MNEAEIKSVLERTEIPEGNKQVCLIALRDFKKYRELAEAWLARKWPEKKPTNSPDWREERDSIIFNSAIDSCRLASIVSEEEIARIIIDKHIMTQGAMDTDTFVVVPHKELAHAIAAHINQRKGEGK